MYFLFMLSPIGMLLGEHRFINHSMFPYPFCFSYPLCTQCCSSRLYCFHPPTRCPCLCCSFFCDGLKRLMETAFITFATNSSEWEGLDYIICNPFLLRFEGCLGDPRSVRFSSSCFFGQCQRNSLFVGEILFFVTRI